MFQEWRDWAAESRYPFSDPSPVLAPGGASLPDACFVDAAFTPIGLVGPLRLSMLGTDSAEVSDSSGVVGVCSDMSPAILVFEDAHGRSVGVLVKGGGYSPPGEDMVIEAPGGEFCATCVMPQNQPGVRGLLVGDVLLTGDVAWLGASGLRCDSRWESDASGLVGVLRLSAWPDMLTRPCSLLPPPITCVAAAQVEGGPLTAVSAGGVVTLGAVPSVTLSGACAAGNRKATTKPAGVCVTPAVKPGMAGAVPASSGCTPGDVPATGVHIVSAHEFLMVATEVAASPEQAMGESESRDTVRLIISARSEV